MQKVDLRSLFLNVSLTGLLLLMPAAPTLAGPVEFGRAELNRAIAVGMAEGPAAGLDLVERLAGTGQLASYHLLAATRADLLRRLGRRAEAADAYRQALALAGTDTERRYLGRRLAEVTATA